MTDSMTISDAVADKFAFDAASVIVSHLTNRISGANRIGHALWISDGDDPKSTLGRTLDAFETINVEDLLKKGPFFEEFDMEVIPYASASIEPSEFVAYKTGESPAPPGRILTEYDSPVEIGSSKKIFFPLRRTEDILSKLDDASTGESMQLATYLDIYSITLFVRLTSRKESDASTRVVAIELAHITSEFDWIQLREGETRESASLARDNDPDTPQTVAASPLIDTVIKFIHNTVISGDTHIDSTRRACARVIARDMLTWTKRNWAEITAEDAYLECESACGKLFASWCKQIADVEHKESSEL